ncbi:hypothetical protein FLM48_17915 [Shewanella sp. Scap07]|uniref:hypothetical protein n=1 Tax=Shewanella sp. Scap07 TaxID=2589987 RepID=UPI0015BAB90A|nr:hypothetical protein [Shewanella sp. Scap07]QLE87898.1 hypothetical protein FLM48_17915 [Shewanella sp. Scap07]
MDIKPQPANQAQSVNQQVNKRFPQLDNQELVKTSFWISQIFMIVATVAGVYLAAQEGLSQAITFDSLTNQQNNYYLRHALYDEVSDNVAEIENYVDVIATKAAHERKNFRPIMATFVWDNMRYSPHTLETPTAILSQTRRFYMKSGDIVDKIERGFYGAAYGGKLLKALTAEMRQATLPALKTNYTALALSLRENDIEVD